MTTYRLTDDTTHATLARGLGLDAALAEGQRLADETGHVVAVRDHLGMGPRLMPASAPRARVLSPSEREANRLRDRARLTSDEVEAERDEQL